MTTTQTVRELHHAAMEAFGHFEIARHRGLDPDVALAQRAFRLEAEAAALVPVEAASQPTLGILYRSAAWLAIDAGEHSQAVRMAETGLASPGLPPWLREELQEALAAARALTRSA